MIDRSDIQGLVFGSYARKPASCVLLIRFGEGDAARWLARLVPEVSSALSAERHTSVCSNVAFTFRGLERLALPPPTLAQFSSEFRHGMAHPARSLVLGDSGEDDPRSWEFHDGADGGIDAVVLVYAVDAARLEERLEALDASAERFGLETTELPMYLPADGREHFGFRMGVSEPSIPGRRRRGGTRLPLGEFLLGYRNARGGRSEVPLAPRRLSTREPPRLVSDATAVAFGYNGSYLVLRKLEQRVAAFRRFAEQAARQGGASSAEHAAARFIGRWPNGAPLALHPDALPTDPGSSRRFGYRETDALSHGCPLGAHVRRANPRDALGPDARRALRSANSHRLLRRGRLYGPRLEPGDDDDGSERGLVFLALNADLGRQFEAVQGSQLNDAHFAGLRDERDPLLGQDTSGVAPRRFSVPGEPVRRTISDVPRFVRVRGGAYFFLPSLSSLGYLADLRRTDDQAHRPSS